MPLRIKSRRLKGLPITLRHRLVAARKAHGWSQLELGRKVGLPQVHISAIETGKVTPRFNTLLDSVRVLGFDLLLIPRSLVPAVQSMVRDQHPPESESADDGERPLYATSTEREGT